MLLKSACSNTYPNDFVCLCWQNYGLPISRKIVKLDSSLTLLEAKLHSIDDTNALGHSTSQKAYKERYDPANLFGESSRWVCLLNVIHTLIYFCTPTYWHILIGLILNKVTFQLQFSYVSEQLYSINIKQEHWAMETTNMCLTMSYHSDSSLMYILLWKTVLPHSTFANHIFFFSLSMFIVLLLFMNGRNCFAFILWKKLPINFYYNISHLFCLP